MGAEASLPRARTSTAAFWRAVVAGSGNGCGCGGGCGGGCCSCSGSATAVTGSALLHVQPRRQDAGDLFGAVVGDLGQRLPLVARELGVGRVRLVQRRRGELVVL